MMLDDRKITNDKHIRVRLGHDEMMEMNRVVLTKDAQEFMVDYVNRYTMLAEISKQVIRKWVSRFVQDDFSVFLFNNVTSDKETDGLLIKNPFDSQYVPLSSIFILIFNVMTIFRILYWNQLGS